MALKSTALITLRRIGMWYPREVRESVMWSTPLDMMSATDSGEFGTAKGCLGVRLTKSQEQVEIHLK